MINVRSGIFTVDLCLENENLVLLTNFLKMKIKNSGLVYKIGPNLLHTFSNLQLCKSKIRFFKIKNVNFSFFPNSCLHQ